MSHIGPREVSRAKRPAWSHAPVGRSTSNRWRNRTAWSNGFPTSGSSFNDRSNRTAGFDLTSKRRRAGPRSILPRPDFGTATRSEEHTSELQSRVDLVCRLLLEKKKKSKL